MLPILANLTLHSMEKFIKICTLLQRSCQLYINCFADKQASVMGLVQYYNIQHFNTSSQKLGAQDKVPL